MGLPISHLAVSFFTRFNIFENNSKLWFIIIIRTIVPYTDTISIDWISYYEMVSPSKKKRKVTVRKMHQRHPVWRRGRPCRKMRRVNWCIMTDGDDELKFCSMERDSNGVGYVCGQTDNTLILKWNYDWVETSRLIIAHLWKGKCDSDDEEGGGKRNITP